MLINHAQTAINNNWKPNRVSSGSRIEREGESTMNSEFYITKLRGYLLFCAASAAILVWSGVAGAETATFDVAADTFINSGHPNNNAGTTGWFDAGRDGLGGTRRGLFRFDLSSIPAAFIPIACDMLHRPKQEGLFLYIH